MTRDWTVLFTQLDWTNVYSINRFLLWPFSQDIRTSVTNISTDIIRTKTRSLMLNERKNTKLRRCLYHNMLKYLSTSPEALKCITKTELRFLLCESAFVWESIQGRGLYFWFHFVAAAACCFIQFLIIIGLTLCLQNRHRCNCNHLPLCT